MSDWIGNPVMIEHLRKHGALDEAEHLFDLLDSGDMAAIHAYVGEAVDANEAIRRIEAALLAADKLWSERYGGTA